MQRKPTELSDTVFDLAIVGGGITGACLAADAARRGLSVALVEKGDFGAATSSASSKLLHGGIRYLQQLKFRKVRESALERLYFQNLAPHLTRLVPFVIPTFKSFSKSRLVLRAAMTGYEALCTGQNRIVEDPSRRVHRGRMLSEQELAAIVPGLSVPGLTGGIAFNEIHMHSSERMTLAFLETADSLGAVLVNYATAERFLGTETGRVTGVRVRDVLSKELFDLRAEQVINAAGPWIPVLNKGIGARQSVRSLVNAYSKGAHLVTRSLTRDHAVALPTRKQTQAVINRGGRHVFIIPWRNHSLIGTTYGPYQGDLDAVSATEDDVQQMMDDINSALGAEVLQRRDVVHAFAGLYPLTDKVINPNVYQGTGSYQVIDHAVTDGLPGLVSVFGAKYTTARLLAEKTLDMFQDRFDKPLDRCRMRELPLLAGDIDDITGYREAKKCQYQGALHEATVDHLVSNYGTGIDALVELLETDPALGQILAPGLPVLAAEAVHAARNEMACHLDDFVFRRSGLGTLGNPGRDALHKAARLMAVELGWNQQRIDQEVSQTYGHFLSRETS